MTQVFIGLGGNIGDPQEAMRQALHRLSSEPMVVLRAVSSLYRTPPWGRTDQPDFLNAVAELETSLSARALLDLCLQTEHALKRVRGERWGPRVIDMDILWFGGRAVEEEGLQLPHPRMEDRAFVMVPLAEIAPDLPLRAGVTASAVAAKLDQGGISLAAEPGWAKL
jgi:2-amino-4-hydroxy-6-hydroxymethyldihydropteridine diphosphokinase